jgi:hypothetical protein
MAQTGYTPILIYSSSTASQAPTAGNLTNSTLGSELAINITDGKLFYKDNANAVQVIGWKIVPATAGGTGQTSYAVGDLLYADTTTSLAKLADVATGNALISGGVSAAPSWGKIGLTTHVSGTLATGNGGTGLSSFTAGDTVYYAAGTVLSKLAIGAANTVMTSSGSAPQWTAQSSLSVGTASNLLSNATTGVMQIVGPGAGTTRVMTIPNANFTAARTDAGQTFTGNQQFSNNIGMNIAAYAWGTDYRAIDGYGSMAVSGSFSTVIARNAYNDNTDWRAKYTADERSALYVQPYAGGHKWYNSNAFVTGGAVITMTEVAGIDTSGNFNINTNNLIFGTAAKGITGSSSFSVTIANGAAGNLVDLSTALPVGGSGLVIVNGASAGKATILAQRDSGGYYSVAELGTQPRGTYITSITLSGTNLRITNSTGASETFSGKVVVLTN